MRLFRASRGVLGVLVLCGVATWACSSPEEKVAAHLERGRAWAEQGAHREAVIEYQAALGIDPNLGDAHFGLAESFRALGLEEQAFWELQETVRLDPGNHVAKVYYAQTLALSSEPSVREQALSVAREAVASRPDSVPARLAEGRALRSLGRTEEAIGVFEGAVEIEPAHGEALRLLASAYAAEGRAAQAEQTYRRATEAEPSFVSWISLAHFLTRQGDRDDDVVAAYQAGVGAASDDEVARGTEALASFLLVRGRVDEAEAVLSGSYEDRGRPPRLLRSLARFYARTGRPERAEALVRAAAEASPDTAEPHVTLAALLMERGDLDGALAAADRALAIDPSNADVRLRHAHIVAERGRLADDEAERQRGVALLTALIDSEPPNLDAALVVRGRLELADGDREAAIRSLRRGIGLGADSSSAHLLLAVALLPEEPRQARSALQLALAGDPSSIEARVLLAEVHEQLGEPDLALEVGLPALRLSPGHVGLRLVLARSLVDLGRNDEALEMLDGAPADADVAVALLRARIHMARDELAAARRAFEAAAEMEPHSSRVLAAWMLLDAREERLSESELRLDEASRARPDDGRIRWLLGQVALRRGRAGDAEIHLRRAIELEPDHLPAYLDLARTLGQAGELQQAVEVYEEAAERRPDASLRMLLGILYESTGRRADAARQYELALELDDSLGVAKNNLAYLLAEQGGDLDRALTLAREAKADHPDDPGIADTLGWVLFKRGTYGPAAAYLREAERGYESSDPTRGVVRLHLARALDANGETDAAIATLEAALADLEEVRLTDPTARPDWADPVQALLDDLRER